ncbi:MAG: glycosyltransferase family 39 protein [Anaerolineaceae bacterium]|nr:glycosyltransferase family 39 protein [Anaerolineaceae bacterium]
MRQGSEHHWRREKRWGWTLFVPLLLLFWWRLLTMAGASSPTMDEVLHTYHGVTYWRVPPAAMLHNITNNPPLVNAVIGLTANLLARPSLDIPPEVISHGDPVYASQVFMWQVNAHGLTVIWAARLGVMFLALLLAALIWRWSRQLWRGWLAAGVALFLFSFDPNILAHGSLATLDLGTAFFLFWAAYAVWRYWQRPGRRPYLLAGVTVGLALATKFSALVVFPGLVLAALYRGWQLGILRSGWRRELAVIAGWGVMSTAVFLLVYRLDWVMLSRDFLWQQQHQLTGHPGFLLGEVSEAGWWYYFPVLFLVKTPLATLGLMSWALLYWLRRRDYDWTSIWLLLLAAGLFGAALLTRVNIGYRYLLPALPFLFVFTGQLANQLATAAPIVPRKALLAGLALLLAAPSLAIHPHYLAYFNALAGGPDNGWRVAVDSNLDWGQDVQGLAAYAAAKGAAEVHTLLVTITPPEVYGLTARPMLVEQPGGAWTTGEGFYPERPLPGLYAISASHLQGVFLPQPDGLDWFRARPPDDKIGYSLFIYDVPAEGPPQSVALSGVALAELADGPFQQGNQVRVTGYDGRNAFLWPGGGAAVVWAALSTDAWPENNILQSFYPPEEQPGEGYSLFRWDQSPIQARLSDSTAPVLADFAWTPEPVLGSSDWGERQALAGQPSFGGQLQLLGVETELGNERVNLWSYWRVENAPEGSRKIFIHLLDEAGNVVAQHDGLDVQPGGLEAGDEFVQLHTILLLPELEPGSYGLQIGVYEVENGRRLEVATAVQSTDRVLLNLIELK